jgi:uncharacterized damage-inducible protein DinB
MFSFERIAMARFTCFSIAVLLFASCTPAQQPKLVSVLDMQEFIHDWQISRQFTLDVANAMPAELYNFKPNPDEMTFGEQIIHIAAANIFRFQQISGVKPPFAFDLANLPPADKPTATKLLEESFDYVLAVLPSITAEQLQRTWHIPSWKGRTDPDGRAMVLNMFVHTAHHRAQCEVYMRVKGIKPPDYTF